MKTKISAKSIISEDNVKIYYWITYRTGMNKKFKFLHPASSMNHTSLEPLEHLLNKESIPTINIDPRGTGYSQTPVNKKYFSLEKYTKDIATILKAEGIEKPDFIGHSMGFMPSVNYVAETNNGDKIFGICASYHFPDTTANKIFFYLFNNGLRYNEIFGSAATGILHIIKNEFRPYNDQSKIAKGMNIYTAFTDVSIKEAINHCLSGIEINKWNISEQLKKINNSIILIYGNKDNIVVAEKAGSKILEITKNVSIYKIEGKHDVPIKDPTSILKIIKKYE
ncbi:MAG: alpha/beta fold hydrolase [Candidatus Woesearchaeota archaeon]